MKNIKLGHILVFLMEMLAGLICVGVAAAIFIPICISARGYFAVGAEWIVITLIAYGGYTALNTFFFSEYERR